MSISGSLANALTGLTATARMAEVVSTNLSNVLTDGYGRRVVHLSSQMNGGVQVDGISRIVDRGVLAERRLAEASMGFGSLFAASLGRLETSIGAIDDASGLNGRLADMEAAFAAAAGDPSNTLHLDNLLSRLGDVTAALNSGQTDIQAMRLQADSDIAGQVDVLNTALKQVETLNGDIVSARSQGQDVTALLDQRQNVIDQISAIVPVREIDRGHGRVALVTTSGATLIDGPAPTFGFDRASAVAPHLTFANGMLSGLTRNGEPVSLTDGYGGLGGGALEAAFKLRDETLPEAQTQLDAIARDLIERFQDPAFDASLTLGDAGLFTDSGAFFDPANETGIAGRIEVNAAVDPARGGLISRLRDGVGATVAGPVGDSTQLNAWIDALADPRALSTGGTAMSVAGHVAEFVSSISQDRVRADEEASYAAARWSAMREAELSTGVDTDQEMQMLLLIEQAYAANAKVMETADTMIQRLLEI